MNCDEWIDPEITLWIIDDRFWTTVFDGYPLHGIDVVLSWNSKGIPCAVSNSKNLLFRASRRCRACLLEYLHKSSRDTYVLNCVYVTLILLGHDIMYRFIVNSGAMLNSVVLVIVLVLVAVGGGSGRGGGGRVPWRVAIKAAVSKPHRTYIPLQWFIYGFAKLGHQSYWKNGCTRGYLQTNPPELLEGWTTSTSAVCLDGRPCWNIQTQSQSRYDQHSPKEEQGLCRVESDFVYNFTTYRLNYCSWRCILALHHLQVSHPFLTSKRSATSQMKLFQLVVSQNLTTRFELPGLSHNSNGSPPSKNITALDESEKSLPH